jgi:hypothetical protein
MGRRGRVDRYWRDSGGGLIVLLSWLPWLLCLLCALRKALILIKSMSFLEAVNVSADGRVSVEQWIS